jgi:hypothetical protein
MTRTPLLVDRPASYHARGGAFRKKIKAGTPGGMPDRMFDDLAGFRLIWREFPAIGGPKPASPDPLQPTERTHEIRSL